jgi:branched-chain amino acid transport system substrate-binding protein
MGPFGHKDPDRAGPRFRSGRALGTLGAVALSALLITACSSSPSATSQTKATGNTTSAGSSSASAPNDPTAAYHPVTNYSAYVGNPTQGKANPKLSPITIGVVNEQGGSLDIAPQWTVGQQVGADYLNDQAGGIDGHPVKLDECFIPDQVANASQCGEQMANSSAVSIVDAGAIVIGNQAFESALQPTKKPLTFAVATGGSDATYPYGYIFMGDATHVEAPFATFAKLEGYKSVSILYPTSEGTAGVDITVDALEYVGIPESSIHVVGYDDTTTDYTSSLEAADVGHTDLFINDGENATQCADIYLSMKQLGLTSEPVATNAPCDNSQTAIADGGSLPKDWYYLSANPLNGDAGDPSIPAIHKVFQTYGETAWEADPWAGDSFGQILTSAKWLSEALQKGEALTPANINAIGKAFKGPVAQGAPSLDCGGFKDAPAVCNDRVSFFQNTVPATATSPGVMVPIERWAQPPKGFTIPSNLL